MFESLSRYGEVTGVDADPQAVEFCRQRGLTRVSQAEVPLPFEDASFDLITALDVIEHMDDDLGAMVEIHRLLRPAGRVLVTVPAFQALWGAQDEISNHRRRYRAPQLQERIRAAGLVPERTTYFNTLLFPPIAAVRLARRLLPRRGEPHSDFEMTDAEGRTNQALTRVFGSESNLLARGDLPFGVSIACLAKAP
jgi:SAM-dependent methyltransferase